MFEPKRVCTHNGLFHADDVFAVAALKRVFTVETVRSRDPKVFGACDLRVDVGGEYSSERNTFDHHQVGGAGARPNGVPYASFGLVWKHFGLETCCGDARVTQMVDERLVQTIDADDNGVLLFKLQLGLSLDLCTAPVLIDSLNPNWFEVKRFDAAFEKAVELAELILGRTIERARGIVEAETGVREAITMTKDPRIIILGFMCPWEEVVLAEAPQALYVCYPSESGDWRVQAVPDAPGSFGMRKPLPAAWAGKHGAELAALTGVDDASFVHNNLFIGAALSLEGALKMAGLALA
jgi:uncharacterized UPF0160 family protein